MARKSSVTRLFAWQPVPQFVYSVREQWLRGWGGKSQPWFGRNWSVGDSLHSVGVVALYLCQSRSTLHYSNFPGQTSELKMTKAFPH